MLASGGVSEGPFSKLPARAFHGAAAHADGHGEDGDCSCGT